MCLRDGCFQHIIQNPEYLKKGKLMNDQNTLQIKDATANPAPLGLMGFGMTTVLLNLHNAGGYEMNSMILAMGICYGGLAQVIAGIMEWKKNNTFAATAFISYGFFWLSLVALIVMPKLNLATACHRTRHGGIFGPLGPVYRSDVRGHVSPEPRVAGGFWDLDDPVLPIGLQ